jgi:superfamily I DNA/RNA helicase
MAGTASKAPDERQQSPSLDAAWMASAIPSPTVLPFPVAQRLARLADDQRAAATADPGPVLCVAPAGSGKTTTVVARLAWRIARGVDPATVCALTFNRRAAEELQDRADAALSDIGHPAGSVRVRTFHALGREILTEAGVDTSRIVARAPLLDELSGGVLSPAAHRRLDEAFTRLKLDPERAPPSADAEVHRAFAAYSSALQGRGSIDLDDLVAKAAPTLFANDALLGRWRLRCAVLFIDEAQDLDRAQLDLAVLLSGEARDIFLVGDDDQT